MKIWRLVLVLVFTLTISQKSGTQCLPELVPAQALIGDGHLCAIATPTILDYYDSCRGVTLSRLIDGLFYLQDDRYPTRSSLYDQEVTGFFYEHVINGQLGDLFRANFTPRDDPHCIVETTEKSALMSWPAESSSWGLDCFQRITFVAPNYVDLDFTAKPTREDFPLGYCLLMWANYVKNSIDQRIFFQGQDEDGVGLVYFGRLDHPNSLVGGSDAWDWSIWPFEYGSVSYKSAPPLPYEGSYQYENTMGISSTRVSFTEPWYFSFVDGDGDLNTFDDTEVFVMMFDQLASVRFTFFCWWRSPNRVAWDWQWVINQPKVGETYGYRARFALVPLSDISPSLAQMNREELLSVPRQGIADWVRNEYSLWRNSLAEPVRDNSPVIGYKDRLGNNPLEPFIWRQDAPNFPSVIAGDDFDGDLTHVVLSAGEDVNTHVVGDYHPLYQVADSKGQKTIFTPTVRVKEDKAPCLWVVCGKALSIVSNGLMEGVTNWLVGTPFAPIVQSWDDWDGDLTAKISCDGSVSNLVCGSYQLVYRVSDTLGHQSVLNLTVNVKFNEAPLLELDLSGYPKLNGRVICPLREDFVPPLATASDDFDGWIDSAITMSGVVDTGKKGIYTLTYQVSDSSGLTSAKQLKVQVADKWLYWLALVVNLFI